ncbi:MAG TPA: hydroxyacylglutathione hydrolase [Acetobacteraceae bacterium]|jgi:hydroxyacylglutathione hydrolase|nr:hydroxyacylglutathione hydrolase [Acetobacteraceae bacterium]
MITVTPVAILSDNYAWLLRDEESGCLAIVDPAEAGPIEAAIDAAGGKLDMILLTHHHSDHIAATEDIRSRYSAPVIGARADRQRLPKLDREVWEGSEVDLGASTARVYETPGHTRGHISFYFPDGGVLLCGDTLFSLGCGKLLEGTPQEMFTSLMKFAPLPGETLVCCGHEYTESNADFALSADPENLDLHAYAARVKELRAMGLPTLPSKLSDELECNPFLRAPDVATLADLRSRKDHFR